MPLHVQIDTYDDPRDPSCPVYHRAYAQVFELLINIVNNMYLPYFLIHLPRQLFFFEFIKAWKCHIVSSLSFLLCYENLNSFLTRWGNYMRKYGILNFYLQIKVFCDTGAERKARNEERRANKRKMNNTGAFYVHLFFLICFFLQVVENLRTKALAE